MHIDLLFGLSTTTKMVMAALELAVKGFLLFRRQNRIKLLDRLRARRGLLLRGLQECRHAVSALGCCHGCDRRCFGSCRSGALQLVSERLPGRFLCRGQIQLVVQRCLALGDAFDRLCAMRTKYAPVTTPAGWRGAGIRRGKGGATQPERCDGDDNTLAKCFHD